MGIQELISSVQQMSSIPMPSCGAPMPANVDELSNSAVVSTPAAATGPARSVQKSRDVFRFDKQQGILDKGSGANAAVGAIKVEAAVAEDYSHRYRHDREDKLPKSFDEMRQMLAQRAVRDLEPVGLPDPGATDEDLLELVQSLVDENCELHAKLGLRPWASSLMAEQ